MLYFPHLYLYDALLGQGSQELLPCFRRQCLRMAEKERVVPTEDIFIRDAGDLLGLRSNITQGDISNCLQIIPTSLSRHRKCCHLAPQLVLLLVVDWKGWKGHPNHHQTAGVNLAKAASKQVGNKGLAASVGHDADEVEPIEQCID